MKRVFTSGLTCILAACASSPPQGRDTRPQLYDLAIIGGRVMDPESGFDAVRNIGVIGGTVTTITSDTLSARKTIDARGLVVAPGFIDLYQHDLSPEVLRLKSADGVTSAFEMELGVTDIDEWYAMSEGKSAINFGAAIGHPTVRTKVLTGLRLSFGSALMPTLPSSIHRRLRIDLPSSSRFKRRRASRT